MKNVEAWRPGKFVLRGGRLRASRDRRAVGIGSRLHADLVARFYDRALKLHARGRLVDLGCGAVPLYEAYHDRVDEIVCVDWPGSIHGAAHLDFECDLSQPLPFPNNRFDTVILSDVLEHIPMPETVWREMARVLAPGGKIILNVPFLYWLHETPHDYYRYTEFALRRFAALAGLDVELLEPIGGAPEVLADIRGKMLARVPVIGTPLAILVQTVTGWLVRSPFGRGLSKRTAHLFPLGYAMVAAKPPLR